ncbi:hypothetical protein JCGZ_09732 [Jatropha curcas]|uniref:cysteine dioxygenase n=1 Tax=Jatropha curcas TaxID=180498 RepID=A0A067LE05_JATCU|nr:plant cysteine oxidase 2 [Jatropha curcas]KDP45483.1 hypothetical protein JCGZ_09732 [Jatropha curcas]
MGIETSVAKKKEKEEFCELEKEKNPILDPSPKPKANTNSRGGKKIRRRQQQKKTVMVSPVQKLYDTCKEVFTFGGPGIVPPPDKIEKLKAVLDDIKPEDVGLSPEMPYFRTPAAGRTPAIRYLHLHECDKFSMGIFCLRPSGVIPLHNHPGMTVFSKVLFGEMHIKSYDWVVNGPSNGSGVVTYSEAMQPEIQQPDVNRPNIQQPEIQQPPIQLAKVKVNSNFTAPCDTRILYPSDGGNMHCFTAVTACAVLDVLGPPYSDPDGRHCTYYYDFPFANFSVDGVSVPDEERENYAWLQDRGRLPEEFVVVGELYRGPKIEI